MRMGGQTPEQQLLRRAVFHRLKSRRGPQKTICAVAASKLIAVYHMLNNGTFHQDLGVDYFDRRSPEAV